MRTDEVAEGYDAVRSDGGLVHIRPLISADVASLNGLVDRLSERSLYHRFFSIDREMAHNYMSTLGPGRAGSRRIVAVVAGRVVAVGGYDRLSPITAEVALLVDDPAQGRGIGTLLLEELTLLARADGIEELVAEVLTENRQILAVLNDLGVPLRTRRFGTEQEVVCDLKELDAALPAVAARERAAVRASLRPALAPRSVVIVGGSERLRSAGRALVEGVRAAGFRGDQFVVNGRGGTVLGQPAYRSVLDLPMAPDLAIVAVPAAVVPAVLRECGERGVRGVVLVSSGFRESGRSGADREAEVVGIVRRYGMRLVGPNCLGIVNTDPDVRLTATLAPIAGEAGGLGLASQSGALGIAVAADAGRHGIGVSSFVSMGNKADVSSNDLLMWWADDPRTTVVALYLESFGNPRKFVRVAREVSRRKPVLALKSGRTAAGERGGASHTAAAATPDHLVDALCAQANVVRVDTIEDLVDTARVLDGGLLPAGPRIAVVGNSGGPEILATDAAEPAGLVLPVLSPATQDALRCAVPSSAGISNPVDLGAGMTRDQLATVLAILSDCGEIDAIAVVSAETAAIETDEIVAVVADAATRCALVASVLGASPSSWRGFVPFDYPERAVAALGRAWRYAKSRAVESAPIRHLAGLDEPAAAAHLAGVPDSWLAPDTAAAVMTAYGIALPPQSVVSTVSEAVRAAEALGWPVAVKAVGPIHKSDVSGVRLDLRSTEDVEKAANDLRAISGRLLVQRQEGRGVELIVGALRDAALGPVVMLGFGGVLADVLTDRVFRLAPLSDRDAEEMILAIQPQRLLDGFRGRPPVDRTELHDLLLRVSALVAGQLRIAELDLNPVLGNESGLHAVDVKIRLSPPGVRDEPLLRTLRPVGHG